jgi:hypothetical protein
MNLSELRQGIRDHVSSIQVIVATYKATCMDEFTQLMAEGKLSEDGLAEYLQESAEGLTDVNQALEMFQEGVECLYFEEVPESDNGGGNGMSKADKVGLGIPGEPDPETAFERVSSNAAPKAPAPKPSTINRNKTIEDVVLALLAKDGWVSSYQIGIHVTEQLRLRHGIKLESDDDKKRLSMDIKNALSRLRRWKKIRNNKTKGKFYALIGNQSEPPATP